MAKYVIRVDGPATLYIGPSSCVADSTALAAISSDLGVTETGIQISYNTLTHRVNSDDQGGSEGNPTEMLVEGAQATIRGVLVKINEAVLGALKAGLYNMAEGTIPIPGTPLFAGGYGFGLNVVGAVKSYYFPKCELASNPREWNVSSQETKVSFSFTAYPVYLTSSGVTTGHVYFPSNSGNLIVPECSTAYGGNSYQAGSGTGS